MLTVYLMMATLLLLVATVFWFAGSRPLLNTVDYESIGDARSFNRFIGTRMLMPAGVAALGAWFVQRSPALAVPLVFAIMLALIASVIWIGVGSKRFTTRHSSCAGEHRES